MAGTVQKPEKSQPVAIDTKTSIIDGLIVERQRFDDKGITSTQIEDMENNRMHIIESDDVEELRDHRAFISIFTPGDWCYVRNSESKEIDILIVDKASKIEADAEGISENNRGVRYEPFQISLRQNAAKERYYLEFQKPDAVVASIFQAMDAEYDCQGRIRLEGAPVALFKLGLSLRPFESETD